MHGGVSQSGKSPPGTAAPSRRIPDHIAIIMDGNGRWAKARNKERIEGHRAGTDRLHEVVAHCREIGVKYLTMYSFSTENWKRSKNEVLALMSLFAEKLKEELKQQRFQTMGVKVVSIGDIARLPVAVRLILRELEARTAKNTKMQAIFALSYGGREEIVHAARKLVADARAGRLRPEDVTEENFASNLYTAGVPDPDLLIRTGGESRISNFLLWQVAYSELVVVPELWPDFTPASLDRCIAEFNSRERRFGKTSEQLAEEEKNSTARPDGKRRASAAP